MSYNTTAMTSFSFYLTMGGWWRSLLSPDGVAPSRMVSVSAYVNLPLIHKVEKFSSGTGSPGWSRKKGRKTVVVVVWCITQQKQLVNNFDKQTTSYVDAITLAA